MGSMYEAIMSLPLFYGINREQVSRFVGSTKLRFSNYKAGEPICAPGEELDELKIILSGKARVTHTNARGTLKLAETCGSGRVLGAEHLFGLYMKLPFSAEAIETTGVMSFTKEEYLKLLRHDGIFLMNYLNYLAARAQRPVEIIMNKSTAMLDDFLAKWLMFLSEPQSESHTLIGTVSALSDATNLSEKDVVLQIAGLEKLGLVSFDGEKMEILDRLAIIERITE